MTRFFAWASQLRRPLLFSRIHAVVQRQHSSVRPHPLPVVCARIVAPAWCSGLTVLSLACGGVRMHVLSVLATALLVTMTAGLAGLPVPLAWLVWVAASVVSVASWLTLEPLVLRHLGCRAPGHLERERLDPLLPGGGAALCEAVAAPADRSPAAEASVPDQAGFAAQVRGGTPTRLHRSGWPSLLIDRAPVDVQILDASQPWLLRGVRSLVVSRGLLDLLEDRALLGLLTQASFEVRTARLAGELAVWLGNLPLLAAWCLDRGLIQVGRLLAIMVGGSLVVPLVLWPVGFRRWIGLVFGAVLIGLLGAALLSAGAPNAGLSAGTPAAGLSAGTPAAGFSAASAADRVSATSAAAGESATLAAVRESATSATARESATSATARESATSAAGLPAAGVGVLLAWLVVPGLRALANWEARRVTAAADDATFESGRGWELLEALETLIWAESVPPPPGPLGVLHRPGAPLSDRADRLWRKLAQA